VDEAVLEMATLVNISGLSHSYSARPLFHDLTLTIEEGERIGLIGPNGAGKSTVLQIIAGHITPDAGDVARTRGLRIGYLAQVPTFEPHATILSTVLEGAEHPDDGAAIAMAYEFISKLSLDDTHTQVKDNTPETPITQLSGGWQKRVALARELMREPDLLLLDEPTNHLDIESILWLETFVRMSRCAIITVTHDRSFLQNVSSRILELDRRNPGGLLSVKGNYAQYLQIKQQLIEAQETRETTLKNTLRREQEWLRAGVKARTTKQQARIQRAGVLAQDVSELEYRNTARTVDFEFAAEGHHPKILVKAKQITKAYDHHTLFRNLNLLLTPKVRIGILGPNGCGKTTLIRILLGKETPDSGSISHADQLTPAYFEQNRESLNPTTTVADVLAPHGDYVTYRGNPIHIYSYLDRFLFTKAQSQLRVGQLSGGEQSRLCIARLMLQEGNLLVLDEPTNDLDLATLGILEDCLTDFNGAVILVTHDRFFLEQVATQLLAFHPSGNGDTQLFHTLTQWETWHRRETRAYEASLRAAQPTTPTTRTPAKAKRLTYKEQREFDMMEETIHEHERRLEEATLQSQQPDIISDSAKLVEISETMNQLTHTIDTLYARWEELERKQKALELQDH